MEKIILDNVLAYLEGSLKLKTKTESERMQGYSAALQNVKNFIDLQYKKEG